MVSKFCAYYVSKNHVQFEKIPDLINLVHDVFNSLWDNNENNPEKKLSPAVPIEESVKKDHIICLEDGVKLKIIKRHLRSKYGLSLDDYKRRWNLPSDYPTVCEDYSKRRSKIARDFRLGRKD